MSITISKSFRDISLSFTKNPITNDIIALRNEDAIKKSVINLVRTNFGERFFNPLIGCDVQKLLFDLNLIENAIGVEDQIKSVISNYEPRVKITSVSAEPIEDGYEVNITINYDIVGISNSSQTIEFILVPTRI